MVSLGPRSPKCSAVVNISVDRLWISGVGHDYAETTGSFCNLGALLDIQFCDCSGADELGSQSSDPCNALTNGIQDWSAAGRIADRCLVGAGYYENDSGESGW